MQQKKTRIINVLLFVIAAVLSIGTHAQQQKPSERSFTVEMNKVKQSQAIRNDKLKQLQKPSDSSSVQPVKSNSQQANPASSKQSIKINTGSINNTTQNTQASSAASSNQPAGTKPSQGPMRRPVYSTRRQ